MRNLVLAWVGRPWAGFGLAVPLVILGTALIVAFARPGFREGQVLGLALLLLGVLAAAGASRSLSRVLRTRARHPPPGQLVDVGGYRMHVLAEGEARGRPAVVWFAGGHTGGFAIHHLHRAQSASARSILVDRPGTGWSDLGPFPRTTAREASEVIAALEAAGERGPFVVAGHSLGGLLAANIARRWPERVAGVVLMDATPPDSLVYGPHLPWVGSMSRAAFRLALERAFGVARNAATPKSIDSEPMRRLTRTIEECLGEEGCVLREIESTSAHAAASASIYRELTPHGLVDVAWETVVYDGELRDLPVLVVAPAELVEFEAVQRDLASETAPGAPDDSVRMQRFFARCRERYMASSSRARRVHAPAGTGHNFIYEAPEFVATVVASFLDEVALAPSAISPTRETGTAERGEP